MKSITLVIYDTDCYTLANEAVDQTLKHFKFDDVLIFSDKTEPWHSKKVQVVDKITKKGQYDNFILNQLPDYVNTSHFLIIQFDGFVINPGEWSNLFLHYDYIGAPWPQANHGPMNVGNGGFSLRSKKLADLGKALKYDYEKDKIHEDLYICQTKRPYFEQQGLHFPHESVASHFSAESYIYRYPTFGFHNIRFMPLVYRDRLDFLMDNMSERVISTYGNLMMPYMQQVSMRHAQTLTNKIKELSNLS
jgi:hypothetical protein